MRFDVDVVGWRRNVSQIAQEDSEALKKETKEVRDRLEDWDLTSLRIPQRRTRF